MTEIPSPQPAHDLKAQALALCHALEEQPGGQYQTAAVLAAFKVYRAFESIEKYGEIRQWVFDVAAPSAMPAPRIGKWGHCWTCNHDAIPGEGCARSQCPMLADAPTLEPAWYAVTSLRAPCIDKAIRRLDVAEEYADKQREVWPDVEIVPLYAQPVPAADKPGTRFINKTNREYIAWCKTKYTPESLDESGMKSLDGLWAWQAQEHRYATQAVAIPAPEGAQREALQELFEPWWEKSGQFCRAGGGGYEKTFAFYAWEAALSAALAAQPSSTAPNLACESVQARLAAQWGYVRAAQPQAPAWQPIETAPRDGSEVLIFEVYERLPVIGWWSEKRKRWYASTEVYDTDGDATVIDKLYTEGVTHWMPLPAAPQTKEPTNG